MNTLLLLPHFLPLWTSNTSPFKHQYSAIEICLHFMIWNTVSMYTQSRSSLERNSTRQSIFLTWIDLDYWVYLKLYQSLKLCIFNIFISLLYVCLCCPHELLCNKCVECSQRPNLGISSLKAVIKRHWKPSWVALNSTWGLCEKIECSSLRSVLIEPELSTHNGNNISLAPLWLQRLDCLRTSHLLHPGKHCWTSR